MNRWLIVVLLLAHSSWAQIVPGAEPEPEPDPVLADPAETLPTVETSPLSQVQLTPAEQDAMDAATQTILDEIDARLGALDADHMYKNIQEQRIADATEYQHAQQAAYGSASGIRADSIPIMGPLHLGWTLQHSQSSAARARVGNVSTFRIVDSRRNRVSSVQRRLDRWSEKLNRSKFTCGNFDWVAQFGAQFNREALKEYVSQLEEGVIAAAPMALLANFSPTLYEIVKHMKMIAGMDISAMLGDCNAMEQSLISAGQRAFRGPGYAACMERHASIGIRRAHQVCNQPSNSAYDGFENARGRIVSPVLDQEPIDIVDTIAARVEPPSMPEAVAAARRELDAVNAQIERHFNPPPPAGHPQRPDYERAVEKRKTAQQNLQLVEETEGWSVSGWDRARAGFATAMRGILGSIVISPALETQFGTTPRLEFRLFMRHQSALAFKDLTEALIYHWSVLSSGSINQSQLTHSYTTLRMYMMASFQDSWTEIGPLVDTDIDRLAYQNHLRNAITDPAELAQFDATYHVWAIVSKMARFETAVYAQRYLEGMQAEIMERFDNTFAGGGNPPPGARDAVVARLTEILTDAAAERKDARAALDRVIAAIRTYGPRLSGQAGPAVPEPDSGTHSTPRFFSP